MIILPLLVLAIIVYIYFPWFVHFGTLSSGDWPYLFVENIKEFSFFPPDGSLWLALYYQTSAKLFVEYLGLSWEIAERVLWFWPFLLLSIASSYYLTRSWLGVLIYTTNTYILMIVGGGQMGVALSYSMAPLVLGQFTKLVGLMSSMGDKLKQSIITGLMLALQVMFDPRIAYITMLGVFIYYLLHFKLKTILHLSISVVFALALNFYWIIPLIIENLPKEYQSLNSIKGFEFFSFADFSHAFSLFHPNWPENVFGKTYFMKPEFLVLPILAYFSLFFIKISKLQLKTKSSSSNLTIEQFSNRTILFFVLLGLIGVFLAKGANPPLGEINVWLFENIPGMSMFRDASKFYILIVMGYSFLIPFSLKNISKKVRFGKLTLLTFVLFWCILIRQAIFGELGGTFKSRDMPYEYIELKRYLISQPQYSSSLWIPSRQRFGFSSNLHPGVSALDILGGSDPLRMAKVISNDKGKAIYNKLKEMKIGQIIVPYDLDKELFILDRQYNDLLRDKVIMGLDKTEWLIKISKFSKISIYKVQ